MKILILAGGSGRRLFPLIDPPKQFRRFGSSDSLLQGTLKRFLQRYPAGDIHIVTTARYRDLAGYQASQVDAQLAAQLIVEPAAQNTAAAIYLALATLGSAIGEHFLIAPSDHRIYPEADLLDRLAQAEADREKGVHTLFGVLPTAVHTGYGYIRHVAGRVTQFVEKPHAEGAQRLIGLGCLWHSGIVLFETETLRKQLPSAPPAVSIDRLVLEQASRLKVLCFDGSWSDLGTWEGIYGACAKNRQGNVIIGPAYVENVFRSLVICEQGQKKVSDCEDRVIVIPKKGPVLTTSLTPMLKWPLIHAPTL